MFHGYNRIYIVLDALDECMDQEDFFEILKLIRDWDLQELSILATSRDEPDIRQQLSPHFEQEISLKNPGVDADIILFIAKTL